MSEKYNEYLRDHIEGVGKAYEWLAKHFEDIPRKMGDKAITMIADHDRSKYSPEEYGAYDGYFYKIKSFKVVREFKYAWLHHIHSNPHHWQHWVLKHDDEPEEALEMPYEYVIEMICDWWSFSFKKGNLYEIFDWYDKHKKEMVLNQSTKALVEDILTRIRKELDKEKESDNNGKP